MDYTEVVTKMANGNTVYVRVRYQKGTFIIDSVGVKPKRKRNTTWLQSSIIDNYSYRLLDFEGRRKFELDYYIKTVGAQVLNDSLRDAWLRSKPDQFEVAQ